MDDTLEQRLQTLEDVQRVAELKAAYCNAADGGWDRPTHDADAVAALFVPDGVWDAGSYGRAEGREAIHALFSSYQAHPFAFHRISNPVIAVDGDRATGEWHVLVAIHFGEGPEMWVGGIYEDRFVRTPEGWKFESLGFTPAFESRNEAGWKVRRRLRQE